ncbi:hypothetical protein WJR50_16065 [Catalinimonas sp. 4WD22]|uniref:hypothetical protein n=1 Tax=Catalinimonas locisalis TaxID=3133978 RepID=UPI0031013143
MITYIRHSVCFRYLWAAMALYLLNISVDATDPYPEHIAEDLSINDQESMVEIFIEKILGYENAIAEYDDQDTDEQTKKSKVGIDLYFSCHHKHTLPLFNCTQQKYPPYTERLSGGYYHLFTPPPKA